ncbi:MAG: sugar ABC transporter permease [Lachnospiraceae bacterium]|nr:sugar ABC transporter permease [Lachnospiraceae bacterium]
MNGKKRKNSGGIGGFFRGIGTGCANIVKIFAEGDWMTKVSFLIMGFGCFVRKAWLRGIAFLAVEIAYITYMVTFGWKYLKDIGTLGVVESVKQRGGKIIYGDNSFFILLFGIVSIILTILFIVVWVINVHEQKNEEEILKKGKRMPYVSEDFATLLDKHFDKTLLTIPVLGVFIFTVVPIIFMICVAFTNYDKNHQSPANLFTWVGFENFAKLLNFGSGGFGSTFLSVLGWTLIWAFFATFLNYFLGMGVAILINKKGIKFKKMWRTILVLTIAVPQFVSLLYIYKMFTADGLVNSYLIAWGIIEKGNEIPFWTNPTLARIMIIVVNLWIGIPYLMLVATGILMNIPDDLYEAARIDGANSWQMFKSITLPYMLFVTGPYLLTSFTGNINNFNVIFLLTQGKPLSNSLAENAGRTDLLVTWLYKMTVQDTNYRMAAVLGILVFAVVAIISLVVYNMLPSVKDEEGFQ